MAEVEVWKPITGFIGYEVSNHGRVRSWRPRNGKGSISKKPHVLKAVPFSDSEYLRVALTDADGKVCHKRVHRLVLTEFVGPCPEGMEGCHNDGNPSNNAVSNLRWGTRVSNISDQVTHGTRRRGERHPNAKLSDEARSDILDAMSHLSGHSKRDSTGLVKALASKYKVSIHTIYSIRAKHVENQNCRL